MTGASGRGAAFCRLPFLLAFLTGCGSADGDQDAGGTCAGEPGLLVVLSYEGPQDTCGAISVVSNIDIQVDLGGTSLSRPDAVTATKYRFLFEWPHGVSAGDNGSVHVFATGEGVVATGSLEFTAEPAVCQHVDVDARCCDLSSDECPGFESRASR